MQSSYRVNLIESAAHPTNHLITNQAPAQFSNVFPMMRPPARQQSEQITSDATALQGVSLEDWDTLFTAVKTRLTLTAEPVSAPGQPPPPPDIAEVERLRATVLECVAALEYLHATARDAIARHERADRSAP